MFTIVFSHHLEEVNRSDKIVLVILQSLLLRLTHMFERSKVNNCFKRTEFLKYTVQSSWIK